MDAFIAQKKGLNTILKTKHAFYNVLKHLLHVLVIAYNRKWCFEILCAETLYEEILREMMLESFLVAWDSSVLELNSMHSDFNFEHWIYRETNIQIFSKEYGKIIFRFLDFIWNENKIKHSFFILLKCK